MLLLGQIGMFIGLFGAIAAIILFIYGRISHDLSSTKFGYYATFASMFGVTLATLVIIVGFYVKDYSIQYIVMNRATDVSNLRWLYDFSAVWAGREGSLLFWAWLLTLFTGYVAWRGLRDIDDLTSMALMVLNAVVMLFCVVMVIPDAPNNPFIATPAHMLANGELIGMGATAGMNPLLQHWAMILHPPTLFIGYAGLTVPFAYAMAALIVNDSSPKWVDESDRITLFSWLFLGAGIGLGSVWAYVVLGWGGYWAWDPVENASVLPWFVGVGLIHSFTMYRKRDGLKRWAIFFAAVTFAMVILGTWITRSGLIQSVHMFPADNLSAKLFGLMIWGPILLTVIGLFFRWDSFAGNDEFESLTSREAAYYLNNVFMFMATAVIATMTTASWWSGVLFNRSVNYTVMSYELIARPVGILYLFILTVCPLLSWYRTEGTAFLKKMLWPAIAALGLLMLLIWEWLAVLRPVYYDMIAAGSETANDFLQFGQPMYDITTLLGFALSALLITSTSALFVRGVRGRMKAKGENALVALWSVLTKARSQSGGYISHIAIGIIVIGLIGSGMYVRDVSKFIENEPGQSITISDYTLTYTGFETKELANGDVNSVAYFDVSRGGVSLGSTNPSITEFGTQRGGDGSVMEIRNARVFSEPLRDIFVVLNEVATTEVEVPVNADNATGETQTETVVAGFWMNIKINPLIWFVWAGFGLLLLGTALAMIPKKKVYPV